MTGGGPRVDALEVRVYTVPTDAPEADGTISWSQTTMILVTARSGATTGLGWTYAAPACGAVIADTLRDLVVGGSALDTTAHFDAMTHAIRNIGRPGIAGCALSAVDLALWDLKARVLGVPLFRLLGGADDAVAVYGSGGFTTYSHEQLAGQLGHWVHEQHIPRVKIKIGQSWGHDAARDLERIADARRIIGAATELFVDANGGYTRKQAIRVFAACADQDVRWFEEPVSSDDLAGLREVRDAVTADVAAGEYAFDIPYVQRMCAAGAVDCMQLDVTRVGGITEWMRGAAVAASLGLDVSAHCAPNAHAHVAAAVPNVRHAEWFHDHVRIEEMFFEGVADPKGGVVHLAGDVPGTGLTLREKDAEPYRVG
ncbi:enolase C-terminal domain-like protein [Microbacterium horticulturae]|uniref:Enolase C-terminal domain-like protein n=1 Tax=Microbacterium horticulturae TaxID=3028316 RepID=A0ABY8BZF0_9MICO|nr:enolase C-terminal domain-like protein [Microbacterium sp. KACC 23027]WEG07978.1 enolase C-terminal domain-like protein [Microbacterium sp. KACC 23027]